MSYLDEVPSHKVCWRDGQSLVKALTNIDPVWFSKLRVRMRRGASVSWVFMTGNLRRIMISLRSYYYQHIGLVIDKEKEPCLELIARVGDKSQLEKLMKLILACALNGPEKKKNIQRILEMDAAMRTELIKVINSMDIERTLLNMQMLSKYTKQQTKRMIKIDRQDSHDSGTVEDEESSYGSDINRIEKVDFECQHDGYFETSFEKDELFKPKETTTCFTNTDEPKMEDFGCQFNGVMDKTSDVVDIDECLMIMEKRDASVGTSIISTADAQTEPVFNDLENILKLNQQIEYLEKHLSERITDQIQIEDRMRDKERFNVELKKQLDQAQQEQKSLMTSLRMAEEKIANLRSDIMDKEEIEKKTHAFEKKLELLMKENTQMEKEKEELEERIFELELEKKRQSYYSENLLRLHLSNLTPERMRRSHLMIQSDATSCVSSGFVSGYSTNESWKSQTQVKALPSSVTLVRDLEEEKERLTELIGVMEVREEQLLDQVEEIGAAKEKAEEKVRDTERILVERDARDQLGRKFKNTLLLTAAFGAVHQAIHQEMVTSCIPM